MRNDLSAGEAPVAAKLRDLVILGGGGHAAVVAESAARLGWRVVAIAASQTTLASVRNLGDPEGEGRARVEALVESGAQLHGAIGSPSVRARWVAQFGLAHFATIADPTATVSPSARVAAGVYIGAGAVVNARAELGSCAIVNTRAVIEHDCIVEAFAHVSPAAVLCGSVRVSEGAQVGAGAVVIPGRTIGARSIVGAGAVVVRDVPRGVTAAGVPARVLTSDASTLMDE